MIVCECKYNGLRTINKGFNNTKNKMVTKVKTQKTGDEKFDIFWERFPTKRKGGKKVALSRFNRLSEEIKDYVIYDVLERKTNHKGWLKEEGEYIPAPEVYLNKEQWLIPIDYVIKIERKVMSWPDYFNEQKMMIGQVDNGWVYGGREYKDKLDIVQAIRDNYQAYTK